jgi:hypothetical protein
MKPNSAGKYALLTMIALAIAFGAWLKFLPSETVVGAAAVRPLPATISLAGPASIYPRTDINPGLTNPNISQANIKDNICKKGWSTSSIRPPSSYTTRLKIQQIKQYGFKDTNPADYEEDHIISLELGGHPTDRRNLYPEAYAPVPGAHQKDKVENYLHAQVCAGKITLEIAQFAISHDWYRVYKDAGLK